VHVVKEDLVRRGLLFAGTERGAFVSFDDGDHWQPLQRNLPVTSVRDFVVYGNDLIVATHGRGFWVMDDISALRQVTAEVLQADAWLFRPADAINVVPGDDDGTPLQRDEPQAQNPPDGVVLDLYLKAAAPGAVTLEILDATGKVLRKWPGEAAEGPRGGRGTLAREPAFERLTVGGRCAVVARDQIERITPNIPRPPEIAAATRARVHPIHQRRHESAAVIVLPQLTKHQGNLQCDRGRVAIPTRLCVAPAEVVDVPRRRDVVQRITRLVREPARKPSGILDAAHHDDVRRARTADCGHQLLHAGRLVAHAGAGSALTPATPRLRRIAVAVGKRLVEQIEDDTIVAAKGGSDLAPELRCVVAIRHGRLAERHHRVRSAPVQVEDHDETGAIQPSDEIADRSAVVIARVRRLHAVDGEPAGLI